MDTSFIEWFQPFECSDNGRSRMVRFIPAGSLNNLRERFLGVLASSHQALIGFQIHRNRFGCHACIYACIRLSSQSNRAVLVRIQIADSENPPSRLIILLDRRGSRRAPRSELMPTAATMSHSFLIHSRLLAGIKIIGDTRLGRRLALPNTLKYPYRRKQRRILATA
jgi:hypothetical protein